MKTYSNATNHPTIQSLSLIDKALADQALTDQALTDQALTNQSLTNQSLTNRALIDQPSDQRRTSPQIFGQRWLRTIRQWFTHEPDAIKIWVTYGHRQQALWHATDRHTGKFIRHASEDEMRRWVEQRISGAK